MKIVKNILLNETEKNKKKKEEKKDSCALNNLSLFGHFCRMGPLSLSKLVKWISKC